MKGDLFPLDLKTDPDIYLIMAQNFDTPVGRYRLSYYRYKGNIYWEKRKNGELVERQCFNDMPYLLEKIPNNQN